MSMTRDAYAKEVIRAAEAAFGRNEVVLCPHEDCEEHLSVVRQNVYSTRSLFCPIHGHIFQEQKANPLGKLDWDGTKERVDAELAEFDWEGEDDSEEEYQ